MGTVWLRLRRELRTRGRANLAVVLLLGLIGGVGIAAAAGARRNATAWERLATRADIYDVLVNPDDGVDSRLDPGQVERLPGVERLGRLAGVFVLPTTGDGGPDLAADYRGLTLAAADDHVFVDRDQFKMLGGRPPDPRRPHEILVSPGLAASQGVTVGGRVGLWVAPPEEMFGWYESGAKGPPPGGAEEFTVVGIGVNPDDYFTDEAFRGELLVFSHAFLRAHPESVYFVGYLAHLAGGADAVPAFRRAVERLVPREAIEFQTSAVTTEKANRATRPQTTALGIFAALVALTGIFVTGQAMSRRLAMDADDLPWLHALGMTRRDLTLVALCRTAIVGCSGGLLAAVVAVALSPLFPVGVARALEPNRGFELNLVIVGAGAALAVLSLVLWMLVPIRRMTRAATVARATDAQPRPSRLATFTASAGGGPSLVTGLRLAFERGRGRTSVPVRSTLLGTSVAVATLVAAVTFASALHLLVRTPRLYGWAWDAMVSLDPDQPTTAAAIDRIRRADQVEGASVGLNDRVVVNGREVAAVGIEQVRGSVSPTIVGGRFPQRADEIALGERTLARAGARVGSTVRVGPSGKERPFTVVGTAVFPGLGTYSGADRTELGVGALLPLHALEDVGAGFRFYFLALDYRGGVDIQATTARLVGDALPDVDSEVFTTPQRPADVISLERVETTPLVLAAVLAALAAASLTHALLTSVRRRRHDFALLATLGFVKRQISITVAWQATALGLTALAIGLPIGVAGGRWAWTALARELGVPPEPVTPLLAVALVAVGTLVLANVVAALPARAAARTRPAIVLRAE